MTASDLGPSSLPSPSQYSRTAATAPTAAAAQAAVNYTGTATTYEVGSLSESGKTFGVAVNKGAGGGNTSTSRVQSEYLVTSG